MDFSEYIENLSKEEILERVGDIRQLGYVELEERSDGAAKGCRQASFRTAKGLQFDVLIERAMDIPSLYYKGCNLVWRSTVPESHPAYYDPRGSRWKRNFFAGLLTTCGLTNFGEPPKESETDVFHGRISNRPAEKVSVVSEWKGNDYILGLKGQVKQGELFEENLALKREIKTSLKKKKIKIKDKVKNKSFRDTPHMILYHINLGYPLLDENSTLFLNTSETRSVTSDMSDEELGKYDEMLPPQKGYQERGYAHNLSSDKKGMCSVGLFNNNLNNGLGIKIRFKKSELPYLQEWKYLNQSEYVLGLEPANCPIKGKDVLRKENQLPMLKPQESREYELEIEIIKDREKMK